MFVSEGLTRPALAVAAIMIAFALMRRKWTSRRLPYPPGPKGYPIIGNILDFPQPPIWEGLRKLAQEHSE